MVVAQKVKEAENTEQDSPLLVAALKFKDTEITEKDSLLLVLTEEIMEKLVKEGIISKTGGDTYVINRQKIFDFEFSLVKNNAPDIDTNDIPTKTTESSQRDTSTVGLLPCIGSDLTQIKLNNYQNGSIRSDQTMSKAKEPISSPTSIAEPVASQKCLMGVNEKRKANGNSTNCNNIELDGGICRRTNTQDTRKTSTGSSGEATSAAILPTELLIQIIGMLPISQYGELQRVSKQWRSIITKPDLYNIRRLQGWEEPVLCLKHLYKEDRKPNWYIYFPGARITQLANLPGRFLRSSATAAIRSTVFCIGGAEVPYRDQNGEWALRNWSRQVLMLDVFRDATWRVGPQLPIRISTPLAVAVQESIYVIGIRSRKIETMILGPGENQWRRVTTPDYNDSISIHLKKKSGSLLLWGSEAIYSFNLQTEIWTRLEGEGIMPWHAECVGHFWHSTRDEDVVVYDEQIGEWENTDLLLVPFRVVRAMVRLAGNRLFALVLQETPDQARTVVIEIGCGEEDRGIVLRRDSILPRALQHAIGVRFPFHLELTCLMIFA